MRSKMHRPSMPGPAVERRQPRPGCLPEHDGRSPRAHPVGVPGSRRPEGLAPGDGDGGGPQRADWLDAASFRHLPHSVRLDQLLLLRR